MPPKFSISLFGGLQSSPACSLSAMGLDLFWSSMLVRGSCGKVLKTSWTCWRRPNQTSWQLSPFRAMSTKASCRTLKTRPGRKRPFAVVWRIWRWVVKSFPGRGLGKLPFCNYEAHQMTLRQAGKMISQFSDVTGQEFSYSKISCIRCRPDVLRAGQVRQPLQKVRLQRRLGCWFCWAAFISVPVLDLMGQGLQTFSCKMIFVYNRIHKFTAT